MCVSESLLSLMRPNRDLPALQHGSNLVLSNSPYHNISIANVTVHRLCVRPHYLLRTALSLSLSLFSLPLSLSLSLPHTHLCCHHSRGDVRWFLSTHFLKEEEEEEEEVVGMAVFV